jgi:hypothetical protein
MKWMQFLTPVAGMDADEARAHMKGEEAQSRSALHDIAGEEKGHLATLGALVEARN